MDSLLTLSSQWAKSFIAFTDDDFQRRCLQLQQWLTDNIVKEPLLACWPERNSLHLLTVGLSGFSCRHLFPALERFYLFLISVFNESSYLHISSVTVFSCSLTVPCLIYYFTLLDQQFQMCVYVYPMCYRYFIYCNHRFQALADMAFDFKGFKC